MGSDRELKRETNHEEAGQRGGHRRKGAAEHATCEGAERECKQRLDAGVKELVVDFSQTEIINSIGISILLGVIDTAANTGAKVVFSDLNEESIELFEMLGLTKHVTIA